MELRALMEHATASKPPYFKTPNAHTCLPTIYGKLAPSQRLALNPLLTEQGIPPFIIAVGSRPRAGIAARMLFGRKAPLLDEVSARKLALFELVWAAAGKINRELDQTAAGGVVCDLENFLKISYQLRILSGAGPYHPGRPDIEDELAVQAFRLIMLGITKDPRAQIEIETMAALIELTRAKLADFYENESRVRMAIGVYKSTKGGQVPITVLEHQMGEGAASIITEEAMSYAAPRYLSGASFMPEGINIIRVGSCGGLNSQENSGRIAIGDLILASEGFGYSGVIMQRADVWNPFTRDPAEIGKLAAYMQEAGYKMTGDSQYPLYPVHGDMVLALQESCKANSFRFHTGRVLSKMALVETDQRMMEFREKYGVIGSEMELPVIIDNAVRFTKAGIKAFAAGIFAVVGTLPGAGFPTNSKEEEAAAQGERNAIIAAADALVKIAKGDRGDPS